MITSDSKSYSNSNQKGVLDVEALMTNLQSAQPGLPNANFVESKDIS